MILPITTRNLSRYGHPTLMVLRCDHGLCPRESRPYRKPKRGDTPPTPRGWRVEIGGPTGWLHYCPEHIPQKVAA